MDTFICSYGTRHPLHVGSSRNSAGEPNWTERNCGCREKFGVTFWTLLEWCQKFKGINHIHQITPAMQNEFLRIYNQKDNVKT